MRIRLKDGPLDGQSVTVSDTAVQYSEWMSGRRFVYEDSGLTDPADGARIFVHRPDAPDRLEEGGTQS